MWVGLGTQSQPRLFKRDLSVFPDVTVLSSAIVFVFVFNILNHPNLSSSSSSFFLLYSSLRTISTDGRSFSSSYHSHQFLIILSTYFTLTILLHNRISKLSVFCVTFGRTTGNTCTPNNGQWIDENNVKFSKSNL